MKDSKRENEYVSRFLITSKSSTIKNAATRLGYLAPEELEDNYLLKNMYRVLPRHCQSCRCRDLLPEGAACSFLSLRRHFWTSRTCVMRDCFSADSLAEIVHSAKKAGYLNKHSRLP